MRGYQQHDYLQYEVNNVRYAGNTAILCQKALMDEVREITKDMLFVDAETRDLIPLRIYEQELPIPGGEVEDIESGEETIDTIEFVKEQQETAVIKCPWCKVKIDRGEKDGKKERQRIYFAIILGIYNNDRRNRGHRDIIEVFQRIMERFDRSRILAGQYVTPGDYDWEVNEEDTYPYYFGVLTLQFDVRNMRVEDKIL